MFITCVDRLLIEWHWQCRCDVTGKEVTIVSTRSRASVAGSTLVEVLIATLVLTTGLLAMAELVRLAVASNLRARTGSVAAILAAQKMEHLRSLTWEFDVSGAAVSDSGLQSSPWSLQRNTPGFADHVDAAGVIVGHGVEAPASAVYTRRWSIEPLPASSEHVVLMQVLVTRMRSRGSADRGAVSRLSGDARLVSIKVRKVR